MKKELWLWQFAGFVLIAAVGTILHFLYDWTNSVGVAPFVAVNESTWEHMKLVFFSALLFAVIQFKYFKGVVKGFWWVKLFGVLLATGLVPILFYTYNGAFGESPDWLNITFFFVTVACGCLLEYFLFRRGGLSFKGEWIAVVLLAFMAVLFVIFTFVAPEIPLFQDPLTGGYGLGSVKRWE